MLSQTSPFDLLYMLPVPMWACRSKVFSGRFGVTKDLKPACDIAGKSQAGLLVGDSSSWSMPMIDGAECWLLTKA
jgi:hypothetical protein